MKYLLLGFLLCFFFTYSFSQKRLVDTNAYSQWETIKGVPLITDDGNYVLYFKNNLSTKVVVRSTQNSWSIELEDAANAQFTADGKYVVFKKGKDSLGIMLLGKSNIEYIQEVKDFQIPKSGSGQWMAYLQNSNQLIVYELKAGKKKSFNSVLKYLFNNLGNILVFQVQSVKVGGESTELHWLNLGVGTHSIIWEGANVFNFYFDLTGNQIAFIGQGDKLDDEDYSIYFFNESSPKAALLCSNKVLKTQRDLCLDKGSIECFNWDGKKLFVQLNGNELIKPKLNVAGVDIWNYKDTRLQSQQLQEVNIRSHYLASIDISTKIITRLQQENDQILSLPLINLRGDYILINQKKGNYQENKWNSQAQGLIYLVSTKDGKRIWLNEKQDWRNEFTFELSPNGKFVIYYDFGSRDYFSYETGSGVKRNITKGANGTWTMDNQEPVSLNWRVAEWIDGDMNAILLYDKNDVWKVDMLNKARPINITNGFGKRNNIVFRLAKTNDTDKSLSDTGKLILAAFDTRTKDNGFFYKNPKRNGDPVKLTMGQFVYFFPDNYIGFAPIRARAPQVFIIRRESALESPNYFVTTDFIRFNSLTNVAVENKYSWLTTELVTWKSPTGESLQGILYKPANISPGKKYPLLIHYYEKKSDNLNIYLIPKWSMGDIDIPSFVSRGYLVFTPDINYVIGKTGAGALNSVISAYKYLSKQPFVNSNKMGIQGGSFGGFETNFIITHTGLFSAACSRAGFCDLIGYYGSVASHGPLYFSYASESGQLRLGANLWENPNMYIKNSPIFYVDKVSTPILMLNNREDGIVDFSQGVEFFTSLRRLNKKAWMLQYDKENHTVWGNAAKDYTIRLFQFFNHYLKSAPAPVWMTQGIPARLKGTTTGYAYDPAGTCGKDCKVCKAWNAKMAKDSVGTMQEIERRKKQEHWE